MTLEPWKIQISLQNFKGIQTDIVYKWNRLTRISYFIFSVDSIKTSLQCTTMTFSEDGQIK